MPRPKRILPPTQPVTLSSSAQRHPIPRSVRLPSISARALHGCSVGGNAEHGCIPRRQAVLPAEPSTLSQRGAERVRQLGTRRTGSHGSLVHRRVVPISERTLSLSAIALIKPLRNANEKSIAARG